MTLTKHHGLGNDFLISVAPERPLGPQHAVAWCDRRRGIGADGLIALSPAVDDRHRWSMDLWNADGSVAELSGNGLRCVGQALLLHRDDGNDSTGYVIDTAAGPRRVTVQADRSSDTDLVTVDMGRPADGPTPWDRWAELGLEPRAQAGIDMGNPHLVALVDDLASLDLARIGPMIEADYPDGLNIEFITVPSYAAISLRVWERGAGITEACGTGACAAAWAANRWELVGNKVEVEMPGGTAIVEMADDGVALTGPATFVALVEVSYS
ncbi:MAG: diaminopimelate epimerase [Actinomycetota bacterium]